MKKKNTVSRSIEIIIPFSVIRCIKYPATNDAFTEAIINAKNIPSEVLTSINDAKNSNYSKYCKCAKDH